MSVRSTRLVLVAVVSVGMVGIGLSTVAVPAAHADTQLSPVQVGARKGATRVPFTISDELNASVDVGSGNLMVSTRDRMLPTVNRGMVPFGLSYNSLALSAGSAYSSGAAGHGWFLSSSQDARVTKNNDGSVFFWAPDGQQGLFEPASGGGFTSPAGMNKSLTQLAGGDYQVTDRVSRQVLTFNAAGRVDKVTDRNGQSTTFTYNAAGDQVATATTATGDTASFSFSDGRLDAISGEGRLMVPGTSDPVSEYFYDSSGRLASIVEVPPHSGLPPIGGWPQSTVASFTWTSGGDLASITDAVGNVTSFTWDRSHRVTSVKQGKGSNMATTRFDYVSSTKTEVADPTSNQSQSVPQAAHTTYTVNGGKLVTKVVDPLGHSRSKSYTSFDAVASATNGVGGTTSGSFGANGGRSMTKATAPTGASSSWSYGSGTGAYDVMGSTDSQGNASTMTYSGTGNPTSTTNGGGAKASVTYHADGTVATSTDPAGHRTTYTEDTSDKVISRITPPSGSGLGSITLSGNPLVAVTNGAGETTTYSYDQKYRVTKEASSDDTIDYTYDADGRVTRRTDAHRVTNYTYDSRGNLTRIASGRSTIGSIGIPSSTVEYTYDLGGNMTSRTVSDGDVRGGPSDSATTTYAYNADNLLTSMITADGKVTRFAYDADGRRTDTWWHTNASHSSFAAHTHTVFDDSGRIVRSWTSRDSSDAAAKRVIDQSYSYTRSGKDTGLVQRIVTHHPSTSTTTTLGYDSSNRLVKATNWNGKDYRYTYDVDGNRKTATVDGVTTQSLRFNSDNEISSSGYAYDQAGRRTQDGHGGGALTWNSAGQMTKQTKGSDTDSFVYAGSGQDELVQQTLNGSATSYIYGRSNQAGIPTLARFTQDGGVATYNNDAAGQPIDFNQNGTDYFLVYNGLGRFIATMLPTGDQNGGNLKYDPYGAFQQATDGSSTTSAQAKAERKQAKGVNPATGTAAKAAARGGQSPWTTIGIGDQLVGIAGWWKRGARWNDTTTGTWTTVDPLTVLNDPGRANPYAYAGDDPINSFDPTGRINGWELGTGIFDTLSGLAEIGFGIGIGIIGVSTSEFGLGVIGVAAGAGIAIGGGAEFAVGVHDIWEGA